MSESRAKSCAKSVVLEELRQRIDRLERPLAPRRAAQSALALGVAEIDRVLPWGGLMAAALHEIAPVNIEANISGTTGTVDDMPAALGFAAALLGRAATQGPVLWCRAQSRADGILHAAGLEIYGLHHNNLIVVNCVEKQQLPWVMEEGLRSGAVAAVLGETHRLPTVAARRLQLAAEAGGALALLVTDGRDDAFPAATRWRIAAAASPHPAGPWPGPARWHVSLWRCRGGAVDPGPVPGPASGPVPGHISGPVPGHISGPRHWFLEWHYEDVEFPGTARAARGFRLAAPVRHGPSRPALGGGIGRHRIAGSG